MTESIKYQRVTHKYRLAEPYRTRIPVYPGKFIKTDFITLSPTGDLMLVTDYCCDGPSGPTYDTPGIIRGAFIHDAGYQLLRLRLLNPMWRSALDKVYEECARVDSEVRIRRDFPEWTQGAAIVVAKARAWSHFQALRAFGGSSANPRTENPVLTAP